MYVGVLSEFLAHVQSCLGITVSCRRLLLTTVFLCAQVNTSPFEQGWIIKVKISNKAELDQLMDSEAYKKEIEH